MIFIVGCRHEFQGYDLEQLCGSAREVEIALKGQFYEMLREMIVSNGIAWIGEECRPAFRTIGKALAEEHSCKYIEIDASEDERLSYGIARDYQKKSESRRRGYAIREEHMVKRTLSSIEEKKLILCGSEHLEGLALSFQIRGQEVTIRDVTKEDWCSKRIQKLYQLACGEI